MTKIFSSYVFLNKITNVKKLYFFIQTYILLFKYAHYRLSECWSQRFNANHVQIHSIAN